MTVKFAKFTYRGNFRAYGMSFKWDDQNKFLNSVTFQLFSTTHSHVKMHNAWGLTQCTHVSTQTHTHIHHASTQTFLSPCNYKGFPKNECFINYLILPYTYNYLIFIWQYTLSDCGFQFYIKLSTLPQNKLHTIYYKLNTHTYSYEKQLKSKWDMNICW